MKPKATKIAKQLLDILSILSMAVLLIFTPLMINDDNIIQPLQNAPQFFAIVVVVLSLVLLIIKGIVSPGRVKLSITDLVAITFLCYITLHHPDVSVKNFIYDDISNLILILSYLCMRIIPQRHYSYILFYILLSSLVQAIYGQLQLWGIYPSHHRLYNITGSFFNPAPFAGYIILGLPISLLWAIKGIGFKAYASTFTNNKIQSSGKYFALVVFCLLLMIIPATRSRACWVATLVVCGTIVLIYTKEGKQFQKTLKNNLFYIVPLVCVLLIGILCIYQLKQDSANGRLFIWQTCINMIKEHWFMGWKTNGFISHYMTFQEAFFRKDSLHPAMGIADNVQYVYNEPLRLLIEYGTFGFTLFIIVLWRIIKIKKADKNLIAAKYALLTLLLFSFFSYPCSILVIKINAVFLLGYVSNFDSVVYKFQNKRMYSLAFLGGIIALFFVLKPKIENYHRALCYWRDASDIYRVEAYEESIEDFAQAYPILHLNGDFLIQYGKALSMANKDSLSVVVLEEAKGYLNNTILYTTLGDSYYRLGNLSKAEEAYWKAYYMVPGRFYPLYLLAKLYEESGDINKAQRIAQQIMTKNIKVESQAIAEIKDYAQSILVPELKSNLRP